MEHKRCEFQKSDKQTDLSLVPPERKAPHESPELCFVRLKDDECVYKALNV